ncbi:MAG: O-antigen polymerase [Frankiales bacterium]|jgi:O-antigen ligase|nr:O-antigen polymerase [Frankiales bacterium]
MDLIRQSGLDRLRRAELVTPLLAATAGVATARGVPTGVAFVAAVVFLPAALRDVRLAVVLWVPVLFLEGSSLGNAAGKAGGLVVLVSWGARAPALLRRGAASPWLRAALAVLLLLLSWWSASVLWSIAPGRTVADLWHWYAVALLYVVIVTAFDDLVWVARLAGAFVVGGCCSVAAAAGTGGLRPSLGTSALRVQGAAGDPNFLGAWLLSAVLLGFGVLSVLGVLRHRRLHAAAAAAVAVLAVGLLATLSRGAYVAVVVVALVAVVLLRGRRGQLLGVGVACVGLTASLAAAFPAAVQRVSASDRGDGRYDLWIVAWRVARDSPVQGVGVNGFPAVAAEYMREVSPLRATYLLVGDSHVVHNTYLQLLAEVGVVGLLLFLVLVGLSIGCALEARRSFAAQRHSAGVAMAEAVVLAAAGTLVTGVFLSAGLDKLLWVVLALGPALLRASGSAGAAADAGVDDLQVGRPVDS